MTQSLLLIVLFIGLLACLPFLLNRLKKTWGMLPGPASGQSRVVSAVAVGPAQRVVTVEVGPPNARVWLVLGVTAQAVHNLHTIALDAEAQSNAAPTVPAHASPASAFSTLLASDAVRHAGN